MTIQPALPVELHLDPMVPVGVDHGAGRAHHDGGLLATYGRARPEDMAVPIDTGAAEGNAGQDGFDPVAVQGSLSLRLPQVGLARLLAVGQRRQTLPQHLAHHIGHVRRKIVMHQVLRANDDEAAAIVAVGRVELGVPMQRKCRSRHETAHGAGADMHLARCLGCLDLVEGDALALLTALPGIHARGVAAA